jgi:hypothetical protein
MELVAGPDRARPTKLIRRCRRRLEFALNQKPHGHGGSVPSACRESAEDRVRCQRFIKMKGLRVEFGGEGLDPSADSPRAELLPNRVVLKVSFSHWTVHTCLSSVGSIGSFRNRLPVAANTALVTAGTMADVPVSPIPPGGSGLWRMWTSITGASSMRRIW